MTEKTRAEIAQIVYDDMSDGDKETVRYIAAIPYDMIMFHGNVGRYIRNTYKLWDKDNPILQGEHPDDVSHDILKMVWALVHAETPKE